MSFVIENTREFLKSHNFDPAQAEISLLVIVITTFVLFKLITASNKSSTITQVLTVDRRSVENYKSPASTDSIMTALKCAIHAPNHFLTEPWRFRLLGEGSKAILGDLAAKFKEGGQFGSVPDYIGGIASVQSARFEFQRVRVKYKNSFSCFSFSTGTHLTLTLDLDLSLQHYISCH